MEDLGRKSKQWFKYRTEYVVLRVCLINPNGNTASHEGLFEEVVYVVFV